MNTVDESVVLVGILVGMLALSVIGFVLFLLDVM